jgi:hypothetical protein
MRPRGKGKGKAGSLYMKAVPFGRLVDAHTGGHVEILRRS